ncbi:hypothetical protein GGS23DRAFT_159006 [Durotheca rogersii]|uniref:uncharacterized protein n=1 Tax=Durotheca rogersii TaxID=419775 RepID=UPI00221FD55B|nr:uncharacterized protein GGS23DRAFT_159006 [Durotheca rogersii]KAI5861236.1 hypothetical protein GGS23DRAFT_159006 [Durotheca rogersii]
MAPPPATPTPHRFLVPRRSQQQQPPPRSHQSTPATFRGSGGGGGAGQQFQATPRFSLHSTPRGPEAGGGAPSSSSNVTVGTTPAPGSARSGSSVFFHRGPRGTAEPIIDGIDSSPPLAAVAAAGGKRRDPIDIFDLDSDVDAVPESSPVVRRAGSRSESEGGEEEEEGKGESGWARRWNSGPRSRSPKRRRISISSDFRVDENKGDDDGNRSTGFRPRHTHDDGDEEEDALMRDGDDDGYEDEDSDIDLIRTFSPSSPSHSHANRLHEPAEVSGDNTQDDGDAISPLRPRRMRTIAGDGEEQQEPQQPIFFKAPRFKPTETPEGSYFPQRGDGEEDDDNDPLPDAFSPHRRRRGATARYVPGGLAAEVRSWFVDVWASGAGAGVGARDGSAASWVTARVRVEEVRAAPGTAALIVGPYVRDDGDGDSNNTGSDPREGGASQTSARLVLAGSPRPVGIDRGPEVLPGAVVGIGRPTWEVQLPDLGRWVVACEWAVLGNEGVAGQRHADV